MSTIVFKESNKRGNCNQPKRQENMWHKIDFSERKEMPNRGSGKSWCLKLYNSPHKSKYIAAKLVSGVWAQLYPHCGIFHCIQIHLWHKLCMWIQVGLFCVPSYTYIIWSVNNLFKATWLYCFLWTSKAENLTGRHGQCQHPLWHCHVFWLALPRPQPLPV